MYEEIGSLKTNEENEVYVFVDLPKDKHTIGYDLQNKI